MDDKAAMSPHNLLNNTFNFMPLGSALKAIEIEKKTKTFVRLS